MLARIDRRRLPPGADPAAGLPRAAVDVESAMDAVRPVCADVRARGDAAVVEATLRFDGVRLDTLLVPSAALRQALADLDPAVRDALEEAARRARAVHEAQCRQDVTVEVAPGSRVTERCVPVGRVGLYVPGGRVAYPSSVVMNVVPAQVAGVSSLAVASPPQASGLPHPAVLAACALLGVDEVYSVGGAQAVAMFAYGTQTCPRVDLVTGPGNVYVAAAKRLVRGVVGVDAEAGPTEIAVLADDAADPAFVAADLIAQAEHDPLAACLLVTTSDDLADAVDVELGKQVPDTRHRERVEAALAGQSATVLVSDLDAGVAVVDAWAPEHLEVVTADAARVAARVRNAGAIFVGPYAPVSLGDYLAGSNHVLPTAGTARHSGGLWVGSFLRGIHVVDCDRDALATVAPRIRALGGAEDLAAHVDAVMVRVGALRPTALPPPPAALTAAVPTAAVPTGALPLAALPLRDDLRGLEPYGAPQLEVPVCLNTNENPHPPSDALVAAIASAVADVARGLNRYPDREATALREDLARYLGHGLTAASVWAANGSNEVLQQLCQAFGGPGRTALGFEPTYSMHRLIAQATATGWVAEPRRADFTLDPDEAAAAVRAHQPSIVFLCSPNNPTATALPLDVVSAVCAAAPGVVVVDEAYAEFAHAGVPSALTLLPRHDRLVVTRTMSKAFALAGARVGYLAAAPAVVDALHLVRLPYHLSSVTQAVARSALAYGDELLATVGAVKLERDRIVTELRRRGLTVADSDANFVLFGGFSDARAVWQALLDRGVLVRDVGLPGWLRVTAGLPGEVDAFLAALDPVLATGVPAAAPQGALR